MSEFKFSCPHCDQHILAPEGSGGVQINCPACNKLIAIPAAAGVIAPPPPKPPSTASGLSIHKPAAPAPSASAPAPSASAPAPASHPVYRQPPVQVGSRGSRTALMIVGVVVACAVLGGGGWYFYSQHQAQAAANSEAASKPLADGQPKPAATAAAQAAEDILSKVNLTYQGLTNFSATGTSVSIYDMSDMKPEDFPGAQNGKKPPVIPKTPQTTTAEVAIKLMKPDWYRIDWSLQTGEGKPVMAGAVWAAGDGDFMFLGRKYAKLPNRQAALGMSGSSVGLSMAVAQLFFGDTEALAKETKDWAKADDDTLNGVDCYTLTGLANGQKLRVWVNKASYLIQQSQITLGGKMDEADIEASLKNLGTNLPPEKLAQMKAQAKRAATMSAKLKGSITETYDTIETNNVFTVEDFKFQVPAGVKLSPSIF